MSGVKRRYVNIPEDEVEALRRQAQVASEARAAETRAQQERSSADRRRRQAEEQLARERSRQASLEERLAKVDCEQAELVHQVAEAAARQRDELRSRLREQQARQSRELQGALAAQQQAFRQAQAVQEQELRSSLAELEQLVQRRAASADEVARRWLDRLEAELAVLRESFPHRELLAPGRLAALEQRAALAGESRRAGLAEAALASSQEAALQACRLRQELELAECAWSEQRAAALEQADLALAGLAGCRTLELCLAGQLPLVIDVDHWSEGAWGLLHDAAAALHARLADDARPPAVAELAVLAEQALALQEQAQAVSRQAELAVLASIRRRDMQEAFLEKLEQLGYRFAGSAWEQDDQRRGLHMKLQSAAGDEMVIQLQPAAGREELGGELKVSFQDRSPSARLRWQRLAVLDEVLGQELGASPAAFTEEPGFTGEVNGPAEHFDLARVRQGKLRAGGSGERRGSGHG